MLHRFVCDAKLSEVVSNHLRLDLNLVESFSLVNSDNASNHLWENNHVSKMSLHTLRLLKCGTLLLCLSQAFEQSKVLSLETSVESSSQSSSIHLDELLIAHIQELIEIYTSEGEFFEATLLSEPTPTPPNCGPQRTCTCTDRRSRGPMCDERTTLHHGPIRVTASPHLSHAKGKADMTLSDLAVGDLDRRDQIGVAAKPSRKISSRSRPGHAPRVLYRKWREVPLKAMRCPRQARQTLPRYPARTSARVK